MRIVLPLGQVAIAIPLTLSNYNFASAPQGDGAHVSLDAQLGFALNAPAMVARICLEALVVQFCPESPSAKCYPLAFAIETVVYFGFVGLLWYAVTLEAAGKGHSVLAAKTGKRAAADAFAILFGAMVLVFGVLITSRQGPGIGPLLVFIMYAIWAIAIMVFYGRDLWAHLRGPRADGRTA
jgi:hypothetical protein